MGRRQVLVQLDDELVRALDALADERGTSRSELIRRGARALIATAEEARLDREHARAYARYPEDPGEARAWTVLAAQALAAEEPFPYGE